MQERKTEIKPEFLGIAAINPFIANTSSPRAVMDYSHFSSRVSLINPEKKLIKSGIEYELAKYINDVKSHKDVIVKAVIPRYRELGADLVPSYFLLVQYEENSELWLDYIELESYKTHHSFFGYTLDFKETISNISYNSAIAKDTILAKTTSYADDGSYMFGVNANVVFMSHPSVSEDGYVISESFAKKCKFTAVTKRAINLTKDNLPVNLYGDATKFKFIPDIGQRVRSDGLLCAVRPRNDYFSISDLNDYNICEPDYTFDSLVYVPPGSKVIDVKIIRGNYNKSEYSSKITEQLDEYAFYLTNYYNSIISTYENTVNECKRLYGAGTVRISPKLIRFIADSMVKIESMKNNRIKLVNRKVPIDQYRVEVVVLTELIPNIGYKMTDVHAAKGVICKILPDEQMPVDKNGNRADVITDAAATISRMNLGRAYEAYLGSVSRDNRALLQKYFFAKYGQDKDKYHYIAKEDIDYFYNFIKGLYSLINPDMVEFIDSLSTQGLVEHLIEVLFDDLYIYYPTDNEYNITDVIDKIEKSQYRPLNAPVTYVDDLGRVVETKENIRIGKLYFMFLEKIANTYSAASSAKVNTFSFPIKGGNIDKHKYPHALSPTKTLGETETRIITSLGGSPELISELFDLTLNPATHKTVIRSILDSPVGYDPNFDIDRSIIPYGQTKSLTMLRHIFNVYGFDLNFAESQLP